MFLILFLRAVDGLLKDGLGVIDLKLGLEVASTVRYVAAVGAATGIGKGKVLIPYFLSKGAPVKRPFRSAQVSYIWDDVLSRSIVLQDLQCMHAYGCSV